MSVVIPTCDRPELLRRALASVVQQTRRPDQVVIVDVGGASWRDGLSDGFVERGIDVRRLVLESPAHAGAARNRGAEACASAWLAFLDDDDVWDPPYLEQSLQLIEPGVDAVATRLRLRKGDATLIFPALPLHLRAQDVLVRNPGITGSNLVVSAAAFKRLGGYDETLAAYNDLDLLIRALDARLVLRINQEPLVEQLVHSGGQSTSASLPRLEALNRYADRYAQRMSHGQRITLRRDRYRMQKHLDRRLTAKAAHWAADLLLTSPRELVVRSRRRATLRGGYD